MKHKHIYISLLILIISQFSFSQTVNIQVDAAAGRKNISPYIYGRNNSISDDPNSPTPAATWKLMRDAGLRYTRENGGNNATKYNWRKKISSHPDWYNNCYAHNWDYAAKTLQDSMPNTQGMWAFQLIGYAASNLNNNFNDYGYNGSNSWGGTCQNLAGGGVPNSAGTCSATTNGNTSLYLENWTADSTTNILNHWFGSGSLGYTTTNKIYWSMDNEPDGWNYTHDDVMPTLPTAENFMQLYFAVAKKARAKFPNIKLTGPVPESEWQWYNWNNSKITVSGQSYNWLEFFIKRCAEEQTASGIRLLDVIDIHSYPNETNDADVVQGHRIYFDTTYRYPGANGVKTTSLSGWDTSITKEYIFGRVNKWLTQYMGANHGVTCGVSEYAINSTTPNIIANAYASTLGTFADNGVEFFSPWTWNIGMWETMHLFSRYGKSTRIQSISSNENDISAYSSINTANDSVTIILVNRNLTSSHATNISLSNFSITTGTYNTLQIKNLPSTETFVSHTNNALHTSTVSVASNSLSVSLPALSTTAIVLKGSATTNINHIVSNNNQVSIYPNPSNTNITIQTDKELGAVFIYNALGEVVYKQVSDKTNVDVSNLQSGVYFVTLKDKQQQAFATKRIVVQH
ncbi:MAG TPA: glycoside hydrolase family 44 protein [Bacteroidia bacterium]|nr:glycoside hydrolase family 44 protein [Bacteroidia bacterium]